MRSLIAIAAFAAVLCSYPALAEERAPEPRPTGSDMFSEDGVYIAPGESREVTIAGDCRLLTNSDVRMGFYITPSLHKRWPAESERAPLEPVVTEAPCE